MISLKIRGSIMAVTAAAAAAAVYMAPTVAADTKNPPSTAVVTDGDRKDRKKDCAPLLADLRDLLDEAWVALDDEPPRLDDARTALSESVDGLNELESSKCLCTEQIDLLAELLGDVIAAVNASPPDVPGAREDLARLIWVIDLLEAGFECHDGKCYGRPA